MLTKQSKNSDFSQWAVRSEFLRRKNFLLSATEAQQHSNSLSFTLPQMRLHLLLAVAVTLLLVCSAADVPKKQDDKPVPPTPAAHKPVPVVAKESAAADVKVASSGAGE